MGMGKKKKAGKERRGEKKEGGDGRGEEGREEKRKTKSKGIASVLTRDTLFLMPWDNVNE